MSATRCGTCGALEGVAWSRGHRPGCPGWEAPKPVRRCEVCDGPARVTYVRPRTREHRAQVQFTCRPCGLSWVESPPEDDEDEEVAP